MLSITTLNHAHVEIPSHCTNLVSSSEIVHNFANSAELHKNCRVSKIVSNFANGKEFCKKGWIYQIQQYFANGVEFHNRGGNAYHIQTFQQNRCVYKWSFVLQSWINVYIFKENNLNYHNRCALANFVPRRFQTVENSNQHNFTNTKPFTN